MKDTNLPTPSTLEGDAHHLADLLHVLKEEHAAGDFVKPDGSRDHHADRVSSLLWIARDLAAKLADDATRFGNPVPPAPPRSGPRARRQAPGSGAPSGG